MCTSSTPFPSTSSLHIFQAFSSSKAFGFKSEKVFGEKSFWKSLVFAVQRFLEILSLVAWRFLESLVFVICLVSKSAKVFGAPGSCCMKVFRESSFCHSSFEKEHACFLVVTDSRLKPLTPRTSKLNKKKFTNFKTKSWKFLGEI